MVPVHLCNRLALFLCSRCTAVSHVPNVEGLFVAAHADGNLYVYDKVSFLPFSSCFLGNSGWYFLI